MHWFTQHPTRGNPTKGTRETQGYLIRASLATRATERDFKKEKKGNDKNRGRKHLKPVQEVRMGVRAFRPPPNLMRVGKSP